MHDDDSLKRSSLKRLLMSRVGFIGALIIIASITFNLTWLIQREQENIELEFEYLENLYIESLVDTVWLSDKAKTQNKLSIPFDFKYIKYLEVTKQNKVFANSNTTLTSGRTLAKKYPLIHQSNNRQIMLGHLNVVADLSPLYSNALKNGLMLLLDNFLLISAFIFTVFYLFNKGLFSHLQQLVQLMAESNADRPYQDLYLSRSKRSDRHDELDDLVEALNLQRRAASIKHQELELSENKFFKIFESSPNAILITSFDTGELVNVNKSFYRIYEFEESDNVIGKTSLELGLWYCMEDREEWKKRLKENGEIYLRESKYRKKSGQTSDCVASMQLIDFGDFLCVMTTIRDISETKQYQEKLKHSKQRLQNLAKRQEEIRENERIGIAREIHDELGQSFTGLKIDLCWLRDLLNDNASVKEKISCMIKDIDSSVDTVRRISSQLRPPVLDDLGLEAALEWYAGDFSKRTEIEHELKIDCGDLSLNHLRDTAIFRIYQETLTNIARHSQATHFNVDIQIIKNNIVLRIRDNGIGITEKQLDSIRSIGIIGMQERADNIDAELTIDNHQQGGTEVRLICPVEVKALGEITHYD
ncbi:MAG: histidine kinase [Candidatus Thiodiazotropha sp.]